MTTNIGRRLSVGMAALLAAAQLAAPALAAGAADITPDTTMARLRANESIVASGFNTYELKKERPERPEDYADWTLREYAGVCAADSAAGLNLLIENYNSGVQVTHKIYTAEEIAADPRKDEVELYYFPGKSANARYALVLPGNMSERSAKIREGCSAAVQLHEMGYAVFILRYSVGKDNTDNAALHDIGRAVQYITANAAGFDVQADTYAIVGFSAGGQLAGVFASERMGYPNYGVPRPAALLLAYPVVNYMCVKPVYYYLMDGASAGDKYYNIVTSEEVTPDFPPTYHWFGWNDTMLLRIGIFDQSLALDRALEKNGVMHEMKVYKNAPHSVGTGTGTDAEGWLYEAAAFWEEAVAVQAAQ